MPARDSTETKGADRVVLKLDATQVRAVRHALLVGLSSYGEIERLRDEVAVMETCKVTVPADLRPIHPTGSADTINDFADALRYMEAEACHG